MNHRLAPQALALGLAALVTTALLGGIDGLAMAPTHADAVMARAQTVEVQRVVVIGQRLPRS